MHLLGRVVFGVLIVVGAQFLLAVTIVFDQGWVIATLLLSLWIVPLGVLADCLIPSPRPSTSEQTRLRTMRRLSKYRLPSDAA